MVSRTEQVCLKVPAEAKYVDIMRLTLYGVAIKMGFSYEEIEDMKVAVAEACNNVVVHAYDSNEPGNIDVAFVMDDSGLKIVVKDEGKSFDYSRTSHQASSFHDKSLSEIHAGGLGIFMMQALMDDVTVNTDNGTEVTLTKLLNRSEQLNET